MSSNNPHRFPRPPTLPQSKIQIQTQRDQKPADTGAPTFASMVGRASGGHAPSLSMANGKEESNTPGAFTTSFDLFSIAKMVPAKQRRVSNPAGINETQVPEANTSGETLGGWSKQVASNSIFGASPLSPTLDTSKSMIFRRHASTPSTKTSRRSTGIFDSGQTKDAKDNQPIIVDGPSAWANEDHPFGDKTVPVRKDFPSSFGMDEINGGPETPGFSQDKPSPTINPVQGFSFRAPSPSLLSFGPQGVGSWAANKEVEGHSKNDTRDILNKAVITGERMNPTVVFQPTNSVSTSISFSKKISPMALVKNPSDGTGVLRAAAVPFEPKKVNNFEEDFHQNPESQREGFTHLTDKFYGKTFNSSLDNPLPPAFDPKVHTLPKHQVQWKPEGSHAKLQLAIKHSEGEVNGLGVLGDLTHKKLSLSDAGISQLWHAPGSGGCGTTSLGEPPNLMDANGFNPNAQTFSTQGSKFSLVSSGHCTGQATEREPVVPIARNTPGSNLQIVERLELKALDISKTEVDIITKVLHENLIEDCLQDQTIKLNPLPTMDKLGRRGAVSMQGTAKDKLQGPGGASGMLKRLTLETQRKELMEAEGRTEWLKSLLEPTSDIEIRIRNADDGEEIGKGWLYPYPKAESKETIATELALAIYQQLLSYLVPLEPKEVKSGNDYWRFGTKGDKSGCLHGKEPWYNGDHISFFDMSFGVNPSNNTGEAALSSVPGLPSVPIPHGQTGTQLGKATAEEPGGLRGLVESSTPDYNDYSKDHHQGRARTLKEWNSMPVHAHTSEKNISVVASGGNSTNSHPWSGGLGYGKRGEGISGSIRGVVSDKAMPRGATLIQQIRSGSRFGVDIVGSLEIVPDIGLGGGEFDEKSLGEPGQKQEVFSGVMKPGKLVFGGDEESG